MARDDGSAGDGRAVDLEGARAGERRAPFAKTLSPGKELGSGARGQIALDDLEDRLQQAFERKLIEPVDEMVESASYLEEQVGPAQVERVRALGAAAKRQATMLRGLLAFMTTTLGRGVRIERRSVDLRLLCERVIDAIQGERPDRSIALAPGPGVEGQWDPDCIVTLLSNLITNAVEHGAARKTVRVRVQAAGEWAFLEVTSAGPALDDDVLSHLFEPFACGGPRRSDGYEGLGLGLYLSGEIARAHGGRIEVRTDAPKGTTFRVALPRD
jgi:signal transduction histidine kinase